MAAAGTVRPGRPLLALALVCLSAVVIPGRCLTEYHPTNYLAGKGAAPDYNVSDVWASFKGSPNHQEIVDVSPDIFEMVPKQLNPLYKNPCWRVPGNATLSPRLFLCLPYFYILGVSKCGTTDIYARLQQHPEFARGQKGPHWWDACAYPPAPPCTVRSGTFNGYINSFGPASKVIKNNPQMITGEASSNTFTAVHTYARGLIEVRNLKVNLAQLMHEVQPYMRMIVIFRDPVARYHSAFHYYRPRPQDPFESPEALHERAAQEIRKYKECLTKQTEFECVKGYSPQQLVKGLYSEFVEGWTKVFPKKQFLFMRNEDYQRSPRSHLEVIFNFLGLRNLTEAEWGKMLHQKKANSQGKYPDMMPETRQILEEFYAPYNQRLAKLMGDERYTWKDIYGGAEQAAAA